MIGNIFRVFVDYLLQDTVEQSYGNEQGYYVSKEMAEGYLLHERKISKYIAVGMSLLILFAIPFLLERKNIALGVLVPYYPVFVALIAVGVYIFIRAVAILETYKLLVENEEHSNRLVFKLRKKVRKKVNDFLITVHFKLSE
ncbi:hypothetical protein AZF08_26905 [Bacillus gaemokensis]|nr:hypothetical protein AZF08_26905 [Bacillus gaemokensis]